MPTPKSLRIVPNRAQKEYKPPNTENAWIYCWVTIGKFWLRLKVYLDHLWYFFGGQKYYNRRKNYDWGIIWIFFKLEILFEKNKNKNKMGDINREIPKMWVIF